MVKIKCSNMILEIPKKDAKILQKMFNIKAPDFKIETVEEYIINHNVKTERFTSKRGIEHIRVYYPTGKVKIYELSRIGSTTAFIN